MSPFSQRFAMSGHHISNYIEYAKAWKEERLRGRALLLKSGSILHPMQATQFQFPNNICYPNVQGHHKRDSSFNPTQIMSSGIRILKPLQVGFDRFAQVWLAELVTGSFEASERCASGTKVVCKLFQATLLPLVDHFEYECGQYWTASGLFHAEALAYSKLVDLQGSLLPESHGFYDFILPCGETVCGHVMEYVQGSKLSRDWQCLFEGAWYDANKVAHRRRQMEALVRSIHQVHLPGVVHGDISPSNVIVPTDDQRSLVLIDFGGAGFPLEGQYVGSRRRKETDDADGTMCCLYQIEECKVVIAWLEDMCTRKEPWTRMFRKFNFRLLKEVEETEEHYVRLDAAAEVSPHSSLARRLRATV